MSVPSQFGSGEHSRRVRFAPDDRTSSDWGDSPVSCATLTSVFPNKRTFSKSFETHRNCHWPTYRHATHVKPNVRCALTPPANSRERADLGATSPAAPCLTSWLDVMRADDPLGRARIRRREDEGARRL